MNTPIRILIADDEQMMGFVLQRTLEKLDDTCEIVTARDGLEALEHAKHNPFDLVITDILMPRMNGMELTEALQEVNPQTKIIWFTAYDHPHIRAEAKRLAIFHYLQKPLDIFEIRRIAKAAMETIRLQKKEAPI